MSYQNYDNLRRQLLENTTWPLKYMFKFIVPNQDQKIETIKALLPTPSKISYKHTKNLRFVSITCVANMASANDIIDVMRNVSQVEGVIAL